MDKRAFVQALVWATVAFLLYVTFAQYFMPAPRPATTKEEGEGGRPTTQAGRTTTATAFPANGETTAVANAEKPRGNGEQFHAVSSAEPETIVLGNRESAPESPFRMRLELSSAGASIASATMTDFAATVDQEARYVLLRPVRGESGTDLLAFAVESVAINGQTVPLADIPWDVKTDFEGEEHSTTFSVDIADATGEPVLRIARTYRLPAQPPEKERYDLFVEQAVETLTDQTFDVSFTHRGPLGIQQEYSRMDSRYVYTATRADVGGPTVSGTKLDDVADGGDFSEILFNPRTEEAFWWTGAGNKYFSCIITPVDSSGQEGPSWIQQVEAVDLDQNENTHADVTTRIVSRFRVGPQQAWRAKNECYLGPNDKHGFTREENGDYARRGFAQLLSKQYGWCAFGWLTDLMIRFLDGLYAIIPNYGVAIIILVVLVRVLLHPITKKGQVNMVRMQERMSKLQPKIEQLKQKHGNDKAKLQQETMRVYQEEGINPATSMLSSCAPMAIQMPIWVALYTSLSNNIHMRHEPFVLWINDLTAPDALIPFAEPYIIPLFGWQVDGFNLLPILMGITMYLQQKLMPKPKTETKPGDSPQMDQAAQMQKMMPIMSVVFVFILYAMPSGLNLYIMTSSLIGTLEQWRIRKHIREEKERAPAEAPATHGPGKPRKPSWFMKKIQELQKQAELAQQTQSKRKKR